MNLLMDSKTAMKLQSVRRWHTCIVARDQTVAAHTCSLIGLALILAEPMNLGLQDRCDLMQLALIHDAHETVFGDIPYPARQRLMEEGIDIDGICRRAFWGLDPHDQVSQVVLDLVDMADSLEAALWARQSAPEINGKVVQEAVSKARRLLDNRGQAQVLEILGILGIRVEVEP